MKGLAVNIATLILLGACQAGSGTQTVLSEDGIAVVTPQIPEGYPWKMGEGAVTLSGTARPYTTFDFSIGAMDAAVQFRKNYDCSGDGSCVDTGTVLLSLRAHPGGNSDAEKDVFAVTGVFPTLPNGPAAAQDVRVTIVGNEGREGKVLTSKAATLSVTAVQRDEGTNGPQSYGTLSATITATVCEAIDDVLVAGGACQEVTAQFDTKVQFDSL